MRILKLSVTRLYLLPGTTGRYTLIDTGYDGEYEQFLKKLDRAGLKIEDIEQVYRSWRTVLTLGARRVYPAHGKSFDADTLKKHIDLHHQNSVVPFPTGAE